MFRLVVSAVCAMLGLSLVTFAQQAQVFRSSVDLVHLDVSVLDRDRRPVRGLTASDFTVFEDGKPQPVSVFFAVDVPDPEPPPAAWMRTAAPEIQTNQIDQNAEGRLFVLLIDDAMIPHDAGFLDTARRVSRNFVERIAPADRVAVVFSAAGRNQNFTTDRTRLFAAIDSLRAGHAKYLGGWDTAMSPPSEAAALGMVPEILGPIMDSDMGFRQASISTLRQVAETLISAPQRRKALIYVSPGISIDEVNASLPAKLGDQGINSVMAMKDANRALVRTMPDLFLRMQRANVTIYPIDPCGADGLRQYVLQAASALPILREVTTIAGQPTMPPPGYDWLNPGTTRPQPTDLAQQLSKLSVDFLDTAAKNTGGFSTLSNDFDDGLDRIFEENSSYYLLGYAAPSGHKPGSMHQLKVSVNRPGLTVRTRSGYVTDVAPKAGRAKPVSRLDKVITGPIADASFPMRVALAPFMAPGKKEAFVTIVLGLAQPSVSQRTSYEVELQTNAYETDGRPRLVGARQTVRVVLVPVESKENPRYEVLSTIALPPGRYELRMSAHRPLDNVAGSLYADLDVPDFTLDPLSVSGVLVEMDPVGPAAPPQAFDAIVPITPTSNREFKRDDLATAFMRVYQGEGSPLLPVTVATKLVDGRGTQVGEGKDRIEADRFHGDGRAADYRFSLPLGILPPGQYLLTFTFSQGALNSVERSMRFSVAGR